MSSLTEIRVMATAAFKEAYLELAPQFERASGNKILTTWASSLDIINRVKAGEATDLIVMAANAIDELIAAGKLAHGSRIDVATSWVAMAVRKGAPKPDISSGDALKRAMLAAKSIAYSTGPSGVYLVGLFQRMGIADQLASKVKQIKGEPVGAPVARGRWPWAVSHGGFVHGPWPTAQSVCGARAPDNPSADLRIVLPNGGRRCFNRNYLRR